MRWQMIGVAMYGSKGGESIAPTVRLALKNNKRNTAAVEAAAPGAIVSASMIETPHKSFIIQGFDDFCGVFDADLRLPLR
ncbi:MAG: hypothetical protein V4508_17780 [Pseudomonadota bacterium]